MRLREKKIIWFIIGCFHNMTFAGIPDPETFQPNRTSFINEFIPNALTNIFLKAEDVPDIIKEIVAHEYIDWSDPDNQDTIRDKSVNLLSDLVFVSPMLHALSGHAKLAQKSKNTYMYKFSVIPSYRVMPMPSWLQTATHGDDFNYLFMEEDGGAVSRMTGHEHYRPERWEWDMAQYFMTLWTNFAKSG